MTGIPVLTKLHILAFCEKKERSWREIKNHVKKSDPTILAHLNDLVDSELLMKNNHLYKSTTQGLQIKQMLVRFEKIQKEIAKISKTLHLEGYLIKSSSTNGSES